MVMRYHWGLAVGHIYSHVVSRPLDTKAPSPSSSDADEALDDLVDEEHSSVEEHEVEEILDSRLQQGQLEYLIRWKGYSSEEDTWELEENVNNSAALVYKF